MRHEAMRRFRARRYQKIKISMVSRRAFIKEKKMTEKSGKRTSVPPNLGEKDNNVYANNVCSKFYFTVRTVLNLFPEFATVFLIQLFYTVINIQQW